MWCLWRCIAPFGALPLALIRPPLVSSFILLPPLVHFPPCCSPSHSSLPVTLLLLFSPTVSHTGSIVIDFISLPPALPHFLPLCLPVVLFTVDQLLVGRELKVTRWLSQRLQHRTWVLPLLPARVLCCSQWSCLSASLPDRLPHAAAGPSSQNRWIQPTMDLTIPLLTLKQVSNLSLSF